MKKPIIVLACIFMLVLHVSVNAQVKIGNNPNTINSNSLLELESTNKGFLPPRVALNDASLVAPLTGTVPSGMLVYSTGGTLADGYYYWNGTSWRLVATSSLNAVTKSTNTTLTKTETLVLASNDITLTLPAITASDNGLAITVKNIGTHKHLITIVGGTATIDGKTNSKLTRWIGKTYIAYGGNWIIKEKEEGAENLLDVSASGSWTTIKEAVEFLSVHMTGPSVIRLSGGSFPIASTVQISLPYSLTFQGLSYSKATISAASTLSGPLFNCLSECYFKMLAFTTSFGSTAGEDAIHLGGVEKYYEVKDCNFSGFSKTVVLKNNVEFWLFETDINDAVLAGVEIAAGTTVGVSFKTSETDFINCAKGINLLSGTEATISVLNCGFYNEAGQTGINYIPADFTDATSIFITNNSWNNEGILLNGFDFTRSDGRDANTFIQANAGIADKNPNCYINVTNNLTATSTPLSTTWYKGVWTNTSSNTTKLTIANNRITYQPTNRRDAYITISGNLMVSTASATINIGMVKNPGATSALSTAVTRFGETTLRPGSAGVPFQFSTVIYLSDLGPGDFFELWCNTTATGSSVTFQDVQMIVNTR